MKGRGAQYHPLTGNDDKSGFDHDQDLKLRHERRTRQWLTALSTTQLLAIIVLAYMLFQAQALNSEAKTGASGRHGGFPPATASLEYEHRMFDKYGVNTSPTAQAPGPGLDAAWHDLLSSMMIKVSSAELKSQTPELSIPLADESGYVASLGLYQ